MTEVILFSFFYKFYGKQKHLEVGHEGQSLLLFAHLCTRWKHGYYFSALVVAS